MCDSLKILRIIVIRDFSAHTYFGYKMTDAQILPKCGNRRDLVLFSQGNRCTCFNDFFHCSLRAWDGYSVLWTVIRLEEIHKLVKKLLYGRFGGNLCFTFHGENNLSIAAFMREKVYNLFWTVCSFGNKVAAIPLCGYGRDYVDFSQWNGYIHLFCIYLRSYRLRRTLIICLSIYNDGGLMRRVMVRRVDGREKG